MLIATRKYIPKEPRGPENSFIPENEQLEFDLTLQNKN